MPNIGIINNSLQVGGAEKQSVLLVRILCKKYRVFYYIIDKENSEKKYLEIIRGLSVNIIFLEGNKISKMIQFFISLRKNKVNIIFSFLATSNFYASVIGKLAKIDFCVGGIRSSSIPDWKFYIQKLLHNHLFNVTIFNNYSGAKFFEKLGFKSEKIRVIPNGINIKSPYLIREDNNRINILTIGRFINLQDYSTAINSLNYLINRLMNDKNLRYVTT